MRNDKNCKTNNVDDQLIVNNKWLTYLLKVLIEFSKRKL